MVERWHRETHTFHLPVGETTITLQDVAIIWGLNIDGIPITGVDTAYTKNKLQQRYLYWLGFMPEANKIKGGHLSLTAIRKHCLDHMINDESTDDDVVKYSRCVALLIIGGCMFSDSESSAVKLMYLSFLEDIDMVNTYSWGSAVLAYLYHELCNTCMELKKDLCGPLQTLQIWVWSRITLLTPDRVQQSHLESDQVADVLQGLSYPPFGAKWRRGFSWVHTMRYSVCTMRDMLDRMVDGQFKWTVYEMESPELNMYLEGNRNLLCRSACPLINFDIVEMHRPERCLRQFGMHQGIPPPATNYENFHKLTRQGRSDFDWAPFHKQFVDMWTDRYNFVTGGELVIYGTPDTTLEYIGCPYAGSFTQLLQSDFTTFMHDIHPRLNISPIAFQEYSDTPISEMTMSTVGPSTTPVRPQTEGDEEEMTDYDESHDSRGGGRWGDPNDPRRRQGKPKERKRVSMRRFKEVSPKPLSGCETPEQAEDWLERME
ncbi:serine/threonine-protein phosphatase 7 long form homolog [Henckelia pumila]|uniref:serine/threonine-protein phosphatase 7 long form homolog n=1 Tax=Henckelia pumila TaxID=405737 RepID=UPI003C6E1364